MSVGCSCRKKKEVENFIPQSGIGVFLLAMNSKKKVSFLINSSLCFLSFFLFFSLTFEIKSNNFSLDPQQLRETTIYKRPRKKKRKEMRGSTFDVKAQQLKNTNLFKMSISVINVYRDKKVDNATTGHVRELTLWAQSTKEQLVGRFSSIYCIDQNIIHKTGDNKYKGREVRTILMASHSSE